MFASRTGIVSLLLPLTFAVSVSRGQEVKWLHDYDAARREARDRQRPLLLDFGTANCVWCQKLDTTTLRDPAVVRLLSERFVVVKIEAEKFGTLVQALGITGYPTLVYASPAGKILARHEGYVEAAGLRQQLERTLLESGGNPIVTSVTPVRFTVPSPVREEAQLRSAQELLALAREDCRSGQTLCSLERCRQLTATYPDAPEATEARRLAAEIKDDPEKARQVRAALTDALGEMYLASAEAAIRQGRMHEAVDYLERVQQLGPDSRYASAARELVARLRTQGPIIRAQSP